MLLIESVIAVQPSLMSEKKTIHTIHSTISTGPKTNTQQIFMSTNMFSSTRKYLRWIDETSGRYVSSWYFCSAATEKESVTKKKMMCASRHVFQTM